MLSIFGGAGAQHACAIAQNLGIRKIFIHKLAGILSAYGLARASIVEEAQWPINALYDAAQRDNYAKILHNLAVQNEERLAKDFT